MKNIITYLILAILILAGFGYIQYSQNKKHKADAKRWEQNTIEVQKQVQQITYEFKDFKKYMSDKTDSILKKAGIKPKNVTQITNYNTYYTDTTITVIKPDFDVKTMSYPFLDKQGCFEFGGNIKIDSLLKPELNVTKRDFKSDFYDIEHLEKDTLHFLGIKFTFPWQKKTLTTTIIDKCTGEQRVKKTIIK